MQPSPPAPPPPPPSDLPGVPVAAPPVIAGQPTVVGPPGLEGPGFLVTLPRTAEQLQGLRARVDEIGNQLERAHDQRRELLGQLRNGPSPEERTGLDQQLRVVDARILQLEQDRAATERLLTSASPEVLAQAAEHQRELDARMSNDEDEMFFVGGLVGIVATLLLVFVRGRLRRRREGRRPATAVAAAEDPRIERLSQAVDAIAVEVERIGEGQRFVTQLLADQRPLVGARVEDQRR